MRKYIIGISSLVVAAVIAGPLAAQEATCDDIAFDERVMASYPMVRAACLKIVEQDDVRYAILEARVVREGPPNLLVLYQHRDGQWGPLTQVTPPEGFQVLVNGALTRWEELERGQDLTIFLPEGRWEVAMSDAADLTIAEATFAPIEFEVSAEEMPDGVDLTPPPVVEDAAEEAYAAENQAADDAEEAYEAEDDSEWLWILGLAGAFIIVWFLLRRKKARRES